jgi:apolipoprotein N-acyltransferase
VTPRRKAWIARGLALTAGAGAALAHPPFGFLAGLLGYALLMALVDRADAERPLRSSFLRGWLAGLGYFAIGVWWVGEAFLIDAAQAWMAPFAVGLLAGGLALFWGAAAALYRRFAPPGAQRLLLFAGVVALLEWLRGHVLTGLPWNLPGETFRAGSAVSQGASLFGAYGMTWVIVAIAASLAVVRDGRSGKVAVGLAAAALAGLFGYGSWRLAHAAPMSPSAPTVRIIQADIKQAAKYDAALFNEILARYLRLTPSPGRPADLVIWPEGAIPAGFDDYLAPTAWTRRAIGESVAPGQTLLVGGYRVEQGRYYNSLLALAGPQLTVTARYDKHRLVPFGEYLPLEPLWDRFGIKQMVHVGDGFSPGPPPAPVALGGGLPIVQPLICYESLFPGFTRAGARASGQRAGLIVNISNDAWFGVTSGPWQHLNLASYRAIEEGMPLARATPTGVSALVDAYGRNDPGQRLSLGEQGAIEAPLPPALAPTPYSRLGDGIFLLMLCVSALSAFRLDVARRLSDTARRSA